MTRVNSSKEQFFSLGDLLKEQSPGHLYLLPAPGSARASHSEKIIVSPDVDPELAQKIAGRIELTFVAVREDDGNLCLADSSEVMREFRETCTPADLVNYVYGLLGSSENLEKLKKPVEIGSIQISFPRDVLAFWKAVDAGRQSRIAFYRNK